MFIVVLYIVRAISDKKSKFPQNRKGSFKNLEETSRQTNTAKLVSNYHKNIKLESASGALNSVFFWEIVAFSDF